jgi:hypothetical protein
MTVGIHGKPPRIIRMANNILEAAVTGIAPEHRDDAERIGAHRVVCRGITNIGEAADAAQLGNIGAGQPVDGRAAGMDRPGKLSW